MNNDLSTRYSALFHATMLKARRRARRIKITKGKTVFGAIILIIFYLLLTDSNLFAKKDYKTIMQEVAFQTETETDSALPTGFSYVKNPGQNGTESIKTEYTYKKDGSLLSQRVVSQTETSKPVNKVIVQGTLPVDEFSKGIREKAQAFYDAYKNGKYAGSSEYLKYVSGLDTIPYSDKTIKQSVLDTAFTIKEITIGQPAAHLPGMYSWGDTNTGITADIPYQVKSGDVLHPEQVFEFNKTAYFDPRKHTWLFSPIGPILSISENVSSHFDGSSSGNNSAGGTLGVTKIILALPMSNNWGSADPNLSLEIIYSGAFDNGKPIKRIEVTDVRDDLGNTYPGASAATPFSGDGNNQTDIGTVWNTISVDPKKIIGAKKISFGVYHMVDNPSNSYALFGNNVTDSYPKNFTLTDVLLH